MNIPLVLLWTYMFAYQTHYFSTQIESVRSKVQDAQLGLNESEVAHNLTLKTLVATKDELGACSSRVLYLEDKLKKSESENEISKSTILVLKELVDVLRLADAQKSQHLLDIQERMDRILWLVVWVALPLSVLLILLSVNPFSFHLFIHSSLGCCDLLYFSQSSAPTTTTFATGVTNSLTPTTSSSCN